jgi:OOP family OmpA-OmpF porin
MNRRLLTWAASGVFVALGSIVLPGAAIAQNSVVSVPPPQIYEYWLSISRQAGGTLVFDGYAPDEATRQRLSQVDGADTTWLKLGAGAPARYDDIAAFGLAILGRLNEGRFAVRGNIVSISGVAADADAYATVRSQLATELPQGLILAMAEIAAPRVEPFEFSAKRSEGAGVTLTGFVPSPNLETALMGLAGDGAVSSLRYGSGEPVNFENAARQALAFLPQMAEGEVRFDGRAWVISGTPASAEAARSIQSQFSERKLAEAGWGLSLATPAQIAVAEADPVPPQPAAEPVQQAQPAGAVAPTQPETVPSVQPSVRPSLSPAAQRTQCAEQLAILSAQNAILFRSGAAILAMEAGTMLDQIAATLQNCPEIMVNIEGHTDSDGEARANLALSVARAEAVANALVERGIVSDRLYVLGFGEAQPISDNATQAGKAQNRRIVVSVRD